MLRFQRIQSKFSIKLNILSSKRFQAAVVVNSPGVYSATKRVFFVWPFSVPFVRGEKKIQLASSLTRLLTIFVGLRI